MTAAGQHTPDTHPADGSVTVVIPTKDRPYLARNAAAMALAQLSSGLEVLVVDNGSTPQNAATLRQILDPRARLITVPEPIGVAEARNVGMREATTRWIAFLDDDDYWTREKLSSQLAALRAAPTARWVMSGNVTATEDGRFFAYCRPHRASDNIYRSSLESPPPALMSDVIVDRELALEIGGFRSEVTLFEDWDFVMRYAEVSPYIAHVDRPLGVYFLYCDRLTRAGRAGWALDTFLERTESRRREAGLQFDMREWNYSLAYRASRFREHAPFATELYRKLFQQTSQKRFLVYAALSRYVPRLFSKLTEWDKVRRLSPEERRLARALVAEALASPYGPTAVGGVP